MKKDVNIESGTIWISTSNSSLTTFNALKKNNIQVRPSSTIQYISNEWVEVNAFIYQNSKWIELISEMVIFNGQTHPDIGNITTVGNTKIIDGLITGSSSFNYTSAFTFTNKVNIDKYTKLLVELKQTNMAGTNTSTYGLSLGLANSNGLSAGSWQNSENIIDGNAKIHIDTIFDEYKIFELNISAYFGQSMYIVGNGVSEYYIKRIWLST